MLAANCEPRRLAAKGEPQYDEEYDFGVVMFFSSFGDHADDRDGGLVAAALSCAGSSSPLPA
jgi:hypothetical protein